MTPIPLRDTPSAFSTQLKTRTAPLSSLCGTTTGVPAVSGDYLDARAMALLELTQDLRFIDLFATGGLTRVGADSRLFAGSHMIAKQWSATFRLHPCKPDGIRYPARHDHTRAACAIFSRPVSTFKLSSLGSLMASANRALLNDILKRHPHALRGRPHLTGLDSRSGGPVSEPKRTFRD
jgi:hypothetical protein